MSPHSSPQQNFRILLGRDQHSFLLKFRIWQILKYFLDFKTKKNFSYTWEHSGARNKNVNKFFVKISVGMDALWG